MITRVFLIAIASLSPLSQLAQADTRTWTGLAGTTSWHDADNWLPIGVPVATDDVAIPDANSIVEFSHGISTIHSITCGATLTLSGGTLTVNSTSQVSGQFKQRGGVLSGLGNLEITGSMEWSAGMMSGTGKTLIAENGTLVITQLHGVCDLRRVIENAGAAYWNATTSSLAFNAGQIVNLPSGVLQSQANSSMMNSAGGTIQNEGLFVHVNGNFATINVPFHNSGTVRVEAGIVTFNAIGSNSGAFEITSPGILHVNHTCTYAASARVTGNGTFRLNGTHNLPAAVIIDPDVRFYVDGAAVTFNREYVVESEFSLINGNVQGTFPFIVRGVMNWNAGNVTGNNTFTIEAQGTLNVGGTTAKQLGRSGVNYGSIFWNASSVFAWELTSDAVFVNRGTFTASSTTSQSFTGNGVNPRFINEAIIIKTGAGSSTIGGVPTFFEHKPGALIVIEEGTLSIGAGANFGDYQIGEAGTLSLIGTGLVHDVSASITGPGTLKITNGSHEFHGVVSVGSILFQGGTSQFAMGSLQGNPHVVFAGGTITFNDPFPYAYTDQGSATIHFNGPLTIPQNAVINSTWHLYTAHEFQNLTLNGTVAGPGDVVIHGHLNWTGGTMASGASTIIMPNASMSITGTSNKTLQRALTNEGSMVWTGGNLVFFNASITNLGDWEISTGSTLQITIQVGTGPCSVVNTNSLRKTGPGMATNVAVSLTNSSTGSIVVEEGVLKWAAGINTNQGQVVVDEGATFSGAWFDHAASSLLSIHGTFEATNASTFAGNVECFGTLVFQGNSLVSHNVQSAISCPGTIKFNGPKVTFTAPLICDGAVEFTGPPSTGRVIFNPGTFQVTGDVTIAGTVFDVYDTFNPRSLTDLGNGSVTFFGDFIHDGPLTIRSTFQFMHPRTFENLTLDGGRLRAPAITITNVMMWLSGRIDEFPAASPIVIQPQATLTFTGPGTKSIAKNLTNYGTIYWIEGSIESGPAIRNEGQFNANVAQGVTLTALGTGSDVVFNLGTFNKLGLGTLNFGQRRFRNQGTLNLLAGTFNTQPSNNQLGGGLTSGTWNIHSTLLMPGINFSVISNGARVRLFGNDSSFPALSALQWIDEDSWFELANGRDFAANPSNGTFTQFGNLVVGPGSTLQVNGHFSSADTSGSTFVTLQSRDGIPVQTTGNAAINGPLNVQYAPGFTLPQGAYVDIVRTPTGLLTGQFTTLNHPSSPSCVLGMTYTSNAARFSWESVAPQAVCQDVTVFLSSGGTVTLDRTQIDNGSNDNCALESLSINPSVLTCDDIGQNLVTLTAIDAAGNMNTCQAIVTLIQSFIGIDGASWFDTANWCGGLPGLTTDVGIQNLVMVDQIGALARDLTILDGGTLRVGGTNESSLQASGTVRVHNSATLELLSAAVVDADSVVIQSGGTLVLSSETSQLITRNLVLEHGAILQWTGGMIMIDGGEWLNPANSNLSFGCDGLAANLILANGASMHAQTISICSDGTLAGNGNVLAQVEVFGRISPGASIGHLHVEGSIIMAPGGRIALEIAGQSSVQADRLTAAGMLTMNGTLEVSLINGFVPALHDAWHPISANSLQGIFSGYHFPPPSVNSYLRAKFSADAMQLRQHRLGDANGDGVVNVSDLLAVISQWGMCQSACDGDLAPIPAGDQIIAVPDLLAVISNWG